MYQPGMTVEDFDNVIKIIQETGIRWYNNGNGRKFDDFMYYGAIRIDSDYEWFIVSWGKEKFLRNNHKELHYNVEEQKKRPIPGQPHGMTFVKSIKSKI